MPVAFAVYACALIVTGSLAGEPDDASPPAIGAVAMVGLFTALILSPDRYLVRGRGASCLTVLLPGLLLLARRAGADEA